MQHSAKEKTCAVCQKPVNGSWAKELPSLHLIFHRSCAKTLAAIDIVAERIIQKVNGENYK
jgi:hypothetical protein